MKPGSDAHEAPVLAPVEQGLDEIGVAGKFPVAKPGVVGHGFGGLDEFLLVFPAFPEDQAGVGIVPEPRSFEFDEVGRGVGAEPLFVFLEALFAVLDERGLRIAEPAGESQ